jgi:hypothetical protein
MNSNNNQSSPQSTSSRTIIIDEHHISNFSSDVQSLHATTNIAVLETVPDPLTFLREYVSLSKPVIIRNAFPKMSLDDMVQGNEDLMLHVDVTPDGHGDCIRTVDGKRMFVMPLVREMTLDQLTRGLRKQHDQMQGENLDHSKEEKDDEDDEEEAVVDGTIIQKGNSRNQTTYLQKKVETDENGLVVFCSSSSSTAPNNEKDQSRDNTRGENFHHQNDDNLPPFITESASDILYYSRQNDCLRKEVQPLMKFFPSTISFAEEAFNTKPEAVNIWIGNEKSVSSIHKDHYENIMCVASGEKEFTICPPLDAMFLKESSFPTGTFRRDSPHDTWRIVQVDDGGNREDDSVTMTRTTRWIESFNAKKLLSTNEIERQEYLDQHPLLKYAHPMKVTVKAGDMFYLPCLWYHQVTQTCETVAVNYWYDMRFDSPHWCIFHLLEEVRHDAS